MKSLIVGSTAAKYHIPTWRTPKDLDIWSDTYDTAPFKKVPAWFFDHFGTGVMSLEALVLLKLSHAQFNVHWEKTIEDLRAFETAKPGILASVLSNNFKLYARLVEFWAGIHGAKSVKFTEALFNDNVTRYTDHDALHKFVNPNPAYRQVLVDGSQTLVSYPKFQKLDNSEKLALAAEEVLVVALERFIHLDAESAVKAAYKQLVTSMTKGRFTDFLLVSVVDLYACTALYGRFESFKNKMQTDYESLAVSITTDVMLGDEDSWEESESTEYVVFYVPCVEKHYAVPLSMCSITKGVITLQPHIQLDQLTICVTPTHDTRNPWMLWGRSG